MKYRSIKRKVFIVGSVGVGIILLLFVVTCIWIGYELKSRCQEIRREYKGDCVEGLVAFLDDDNKSFRQRNSAIWTLGQLGEEKALPFLKKYYAGNIPERVSLDKVISQYELKKAVNLTSGGLNITSFFWRNKF